MNLNVAPVVARCAPKFHLLNSCAGRPTREIDTSLSGAVARGLALDLKIDNDRTRGMVRDGDNAADPRRRRRNDRTVPLARDGDN